MSHLLRDKYREDIYKCRNSEEGEREGIVMITTVISFNINVNEKVIRKRRI